MDAALTRKLDKMIASELAGIVALRHDLHAHPQVSYQEKYAASRVQEALTRAGVPFQAGVAKTGVVGWIMPDGKEDGDSPSAKTPRYSPRFRVECAAVSLKGTR